LPGDIRVLSDFAFERKTQDSVRGADLAGIIAQVTAVGKDFVSKVCHPAVIVAPESD